MIKFKDNTIIITNNYNKKYLLNEINKQDNLLNINIITINELIKKYYFDYDDKTIYYIMNKYNINYSTARIYLDNIYYVNDNNENKKIDNLFNIKKDLIDNKLLIINDCFKDYLKNKNIIIYGLSYIPNIVKDILDNYKYEIVNNCSNSYAHSIYEFNILDEEVSFVANSIVELINSGIDINNIYLTNLNDEYRLVIKRVFSIYKIPVNLNIKYSLYNTHTTKLFLNLYESNINNTLTNLENEITKDEVDNYNKLVSICNKYVWCNDYLDIKDLIIESIKNTSIEIPYFDNSVKESDIETIYNDNDYVFMLGFNQGIIPIIYKDEDYLNDKEKSILNIETSVDLNSIEKDKVISIVNNIKNLTISYKLKSLTDTYIISTLNEYLNYEVINNYNTNYSYSNLYNKLELSKYLDLYNKYGVVSNNLNILYNNYKDITYKTYDNKFKGIDKNDFNKFINNKLLLSYSSIDNYNRCGFRYYLNNILKVDTYEETFMQFIGNIFHKVLSCAFTNDFDFDSCFNSCIDKDLTKKEEFFVNKLKGELKFIIDTICEHNKYCSLDNELYEEKIYVNIEGNISITFMGIIDKLKYKKVDDKYVVAIIDYKTGNPNLNLNNTIYGIEMQLPIYIYLTRNYKDFNNIEVAGFYLQKILNNEINADGINSYEDLKKKNLLLQGYSNSNTEILNYFDNNYEDSKVVKGLKTSSKGFYAYSKVLDNNTIDRLVKLTEDKIKESTMSITDTKFDINPKKIGMNNVGCEFCKFRDICFKTEKDIVNLKEYKELEFLGGDANGMD